MSSSQSALNKLFVAIVETIDRRVRWDRFPTPLALVMLKGIRDNLRWNNLFDTNDAASTPTLPAPSAADLVGRTADGADNDLAAPAMGMAGTRFGRNVPLALAEPETGERLLTPNPRLVSTRLLARGAEMIPAPSLNVIAAAWIQFQTRDWLSHGTDTERSFRVPRPDGDPWPDPELVVPRTQRDPDAVGDMPAHLRQHRVPLVGRVPDLRLDQGVPRGRAARRPRPRASSPSGPTASSTSTPRCSAAPAGSTAGGSGLELLHTLFMREHNAVCDVLHAAYPSWSDDRVFTIARLVVAALIAKIHTVEWTTAILAHPALRIGMRANWFGIAEERVRNLVGRLSASEVISGIPGSATDHHSAPYSITEEFVAVYRMHPLIPDELEVRSLTDPQARERVPFLDTARLRSREAVLRHGVADLLYSASARRTPGAVTLHNHPRFMQQLPPRRRPPRRRRSDRHPAVTGARRAPLQRVPAGPAPARPGDVRGADAGPGDGRRARLGLRRRRGRRPHGRAATPRSRPRASASATPRSASSS